MQSQTRLLVLFGAIGAFASLLAITTYLAGPAHPDDDNPATRNPWRGTGLPCESDFDKLPAIAKAQIVSTIAAMPIGDPRRQQVLACDTSVLGLPGGV